MANMNPAEQAARQAVTEFFATAPQDTVRKVVEAVMRGEVNAVAGTFAESAVEALKAKDVWS